MIINQIIAIFLPTIISMKILKIEREKNIFKYLELVLIVNFLIYCILVFVLKQVYFEFTNQFTIKYILVSIIMNVLISIIELAMKKNVSFSIETEKNNVEKD